MATSIVQDTRSIDDLVKILQFKRPGVPAELARLQILEAARYLASSKVGSIEATIKTHEGTTEYSLANCIPDGHELNSVEQVIVCGECIPQIEKCDPCPTGWQLTSFDCIRVEPCPPESFVVCLNLQPTMEACSLHTCFMRHREYLLAQAEGELALMEGEKWASASVARFKLRKAAGMQRSIAVREQRGYDCKPCKAIGCPVL